LRTIVDPALKDPGVAQMEFREALGISDNPKYRRACRGGPPVSAFRKSNDREKAWICFAELAERYGREIGV
jgi:hypothetical protein